MFLYDLVVWSGWERLTLGGLQLLLLSLCFCINLSYLELSLAVENKLRRKHILLHSNHFRKFLMSQNLWDIQRVCNLIPFNFLTPKFSHPQRTSNPSQIKSSLLPTSHQIHQISLLHPSKPPLHLHQPLPRLLIQINLTEIP